jgi:signal transduction histidine kinase
MNKTMTRLPNIFYSIRTRLIITFLIGAFIIVGVVLFFNQAIQQQLIERADESLLVEAELIARQLDDFNARNQQALQVASRLPIFTDYLQDPNVHTTRETQSTIETLESLQITPWNQFYTLSYAILDANGINVADTVETNIGNDESNQSYFRTPFITGQSFISPIYYQADRGGIYYFFSVPIRLNVEPVTTVGVLRARVAISTVQDIIAEAERNSSNHVHVALLDEHLIRIADTEHTNLLFRGIIPIANDVVVSLKNQSLLPPIPTANLFTPLPTLANAIADMNENVIITGNTSPDAAESERIAIRRLESTDWYVVVTHPVSVHYMVVWQQQAGILGLGIALAVGALTSSVVLSHFITVPIRKLTDAAAKVSAGDLTARAKIVSRDEIGILAQTFNQMTADLERITETLENRVQERTQELQQAYDDLQRESAERQLYETRALQVAFEQERRRILMEFIQDVSHEFKTPLSIINVKLHLLKKSDTDSQDKHIDTIYQQSHAISELVDNMALMAKFDSGDIGEATDLVLNEFLRSLVIHVSSAFGAKSLSLNTDLANTLLMIEANAEELWEGLKRILDNARLYTHEGGEVLIRTYKENHDAVIEISDNGIGISEKALPRVFERFFREDEAHTTRGFGLGLPIAKRIIEARGGTIDIDSKLNIGTIVTIRFPLVQEDMPVLN